MSKYIVGIATVIALAIVVAVPAFAKDKGAKAAPVEGAITAVDATAKTVTVKVDGADKVIKTDDATKIKIGKNDAATLADLKVGMEVKVSCKGECAAMIAVAHGKKK